MPWGRFAIGLTLLTSAACRVVDSPFATAAVASVTVSPNPVSLPAGTTVQLSATPEDEHGNLLTGRGLTWSSSDTTVAGVSSGLVIGFSAGLATISATAEGRTGTALITVTTVPVGAVTVAPAAATMVKDGVMRLQITLVDADGNPVKGGRFTVSSSDPAVATVSGFGLVTGVGTGIATITVMADDKSATARIAVVYAEYSGLSTGRSHACGVTTEGAGLCWGDNSSGVFGDGSRTSSAVPMAVLSESPFASVSAGGGHSCGVTTNGTALCWGEAWLSWGWGDGSSRTGLGNGTTTGSLLPVPVSGGLRFSAVSAGGQHSCGVTTGGTAYCWGPNTSGELGDGTTTTRSTPVAVLGGLTFSTVSAGGVSTCGVTNNGTAYCWGRNTSGALGDGTTTNSLSPVAVRGGLTFATLSMGAGHTCGVTPSGAAYCWGSNGHGELGDGTTTSSSAPVAVLRGLIFSTVSAGGGRTCGVTTSDAAYCWGSNPNGQLGNGTTTSSSLPVAVSGGLSFSTVSAGDQQTCGMTTRGTAYCWGNGSGSVPVKVAGQL
jgi:alpha-tubulin suppressor-like RCC1 family protein